MSQPLPAHVCAQLELICVRVAGDAACRRLWERVLTLEERTQLGGSCQAAYAACGGTIGLWMALRRVSQVRAIVDLGTELFGLCDSDRRWLLRETGEENCEVGQTGKPPIPDWRPDVGELWFLGQKIRNVRIRSEPSHVQNVLAAFTAADWANRIPNPLGLGQKDLSDFLLKLNKGLEQIRFHMADAGQSIVWKTCHPRTPGVVRV